MITEILAIVNDENGPVGIDYIRDNTNIPVSEIYNICLNNKSLFQVLLSYKCPQNHVIDSIPFCNTCNIHYGDYEISTVIHVSNNIQR